MPSYIKACDIRPNRPNYSGARSAEAHFPHISAGIAIYGPCRAAGSRAAANGIAADLGTLEERARRAALLTVLVLAAGRSFGVRFDALHNGSTSIRFRGQNRKQPESLGGRHPARLALGFSRDHRPAFSRRNASERVLMFAASEHLSCALKTSPPSTVLSRQAFRPIRNRSHHLWRGHQIIPGMMPIVSPACLSEPP